MCADEWPVENRFSRVHGKVHSRCKWPAYSGNVDSGQLQSKERHEAVQVGDLVHYNLTGCTSAKKQALRPQMRRHMGSTKVRLTGAAGGSSRLDVSPGSRAGATPVQSGMQVCTGTKARRIVFMRPKEGRNVQTSSESDLLTGIPVYISAMTKAKILPPPGKGMRCSDGNRQGSTAVTRSRIIHIL